MRTPEPEPPWGKPGPRAAAVRRVAEAARAAVFPYWLAAAHAVLPVAILRGPTRPSGRPGTIAVAGKDPWVRSLPERVFLEPPHREAVGRVPVWSLARELRRLQAAVDLVVARVDAVSARRFFGPEFLHVPEWIGARLEVPPLGAAPARVARSARDDLRVVRNQRLRLRPSRQEAEFEAFYRDMYVPFIRSRHGAASHLRGHRFLRRAFRNGELLWVERDGSRIAGAVFEVAGNVLFFRALGTAGGDPALMKQGALAALYGSVVDHARRRGCTRVDLGTSRSLLQDGVLRYKRKWGAVLDVQPEPRFELLLGWSRLEGAALEVVSQTSPIFRGASGFSAVHVVDTDRPAAAAAAREARDRVWIPGLQQLHLVGTAGWQAQVTGPPGTVLASLDEATPARFGAAAPEHPAPA